MKTVKDKDMRLMLYICRDFKVDYSHGCQVFKFPFVVMDKDDTITNVSDYSYDNPYRGFHDLGFRCQASCLNIEDTKPKVYGESLEYRDVGSVSLDECERMLVMLKRISRVKFPVSPATFGQYCQMLCMGLGVDGAISQGEDINGRGWSYSDSMHVTWKVSEIAWLLDRRIGEFIEKHAESMLARRGY